MSTLWFCILLANIVVLSVNIWLFKEEVDHNSYVVDVPLLALESASISNGISSVNAFYFAFNDPFVEKIPDLKLQLSHAQEIILKQSKKAEAQKRRNTEKNEKIFLLTQQNKVLYQQLSTLEDKFDKRLARKQKTIQELKASQEKTKNSPLTKNVDLVKKSIQSKPDLVRLNTNEKASSEINEAIQKDFNTKVSLEKRHLSGSIEFGFLYEQDNQITKGINGRLILGYDVPEQYNINSDLDFEFENEDRQTSTDKYRWQLQSDYHLDVTNLVFARSDLSRSKFSSYLQEDVFTAGYGRIFFNTDKHKFNMEIGPGYRFAIPNASENAVSIDESIIRTRLNYERIINDSLQVKIDTVLEAGHNNSIHSATFKAQNRLYQELYLIFDFEYKYTQNVPVDTVNKEVSSGLSLLYAF